MGINFPSSPTLGQKYPASPIVGIPTYTWDGEKWTTIGGAIGSKIPVYTDGSNAMIGQLTVVSPPVALTDAASKAYVDNRVRYDAAQTLTPAQRSQARANVDVTKKNYIVNGAMMISQENGTLTGTASGYYPVDMRYLAYVNAGTPTAQQWGASTPGGSTYRLRVTATAAHATVNAGDWCALFDAVEGFRAADLINGVKTITIQFGVKAPAGTYVVCVQNSAQDRSYPATYVIAAGEANTDVVKSVTLTLDNTGTWLVNNSVGLYVSWSLMCGTTFQGTANTWQAGNKLSVAGQFNFMGTAGNVFELFDVSLTEGTVAPPFIVPDYASELAACRRYYRNVGGPDFNGQSITATVIALFESFDTPMRAAPTIALTTTSVGAYQPGIGSSPGSACAIGTNVLDPSGFYIELSGFTGMTPQQPVYAVTNPTIKASARL